MTGKINIYVKKSDIIPKGIILHQKSFQKYKFFKLVEVKIF